MAPASARVCGPSCEPALSPCRTQGFDSRRRPNDGSLRRSPPSPPPTWTPPQIRLSIAACGGDAREAVKALLVANDFLEVQLDELRAQTSKGYARGRLPAARRRREDPDV
jgi:hypothetical protein